MIKKLYQLLICVFILSCSNFEFVYKNVPDVNKIEGKTHLIINGDDTEIIYAYAVNKLKNNESDYIYELIIQSKKIIEAVVVEKDATASKFNIKLDFFYSLSNKNNNCLVLNKSFVTLSTYDSKSGGYSFGSDLSQKEVLTRNIHSNIDEFLAYLIRSDTELDC